ncbi:hypothetical protein FVE85_8076 [Porphyridium purpureum]|uniref:50S ribosomal protein L25 n=1 Tax=Porphyridium purpureum TaxID=35688 RepID=A0A5J4YMB4_PORPP|nr:hypothetical protein FVE85_8076 [Porphyridium purpureum]|eukprot:POR7336..scf295_9
MMRWAAHGAWRRDRCMKVAVPHRHASGGIGPLEHYLKKWLATVPNEPGVSELTHMRLLAMRREGMGREGMVVHKETGRVRKDPTWITAHIEGGGSNNYTNCLVLQKELLSHYQQGRYVIANAGTPHFSGPLYDLVVVAFHPSLRRMSDFKIPEQAPQIVERVRAHAHCMQLHPLRDRPVNIRFRRIPLAEHVNVTGVDGEADSETRPPEAQTTRLPTQKPVDDVTYRVPIVLINEDKCDALTNANPVFLTHGIDFTVPVGMVNPPQVAMIDMSEVQLRKAVFPASVLLPDGVTLAKKMVKHRPIMVVK